MRPLSNLLLSQLSSALASHIAIILTFTFNILPLLQRTQTEVTAMGEKVVEAQVRVWAARCVNDRAILSQRGIGCQQIRLFHSV